MPAARNGVMGLPVVRHLLRKPRLLISMSIGVAVFFTALSFSPFGTATCSLIAWNTATLLYLGMALETMATASHDRLNSRALLHDDGEGVILTFSTLAAILSIVAIVFELATTKNTKGLMEALHIGLAALTLLTSWAFIHTAFAFHYAHGYYSARIAADREGHPLVPCIVFPGTEQPNYFDFLYCAFIIGTSGQTADVSFATSEVRRTCLIHCVLSYLFNATVLALTINIAASLIS